MGHTGRIQKMKLQEMIEKLDSDMQKLINNGAVPMRIKKLSPANLITKLHELDRKAIVALSVGDEKAYKELSRDLQCVEAEMLRRMNNQKSIVAYCEAKSYARELVAGFRSALLFSEKKKADEIAEQILDLVSDLSDKLNLKSKSCLTMVAFTPEGIS